MVIFRCYVNVHQRVSPTCTPHGIASFPIRRMLFVVEHSFRDNQRLKRSLHRYLLGHGSKVFLLGDSMQNMGKMTLASLWWWFFCVLLAGIISDWVDIQAATGREFPARGRGNVESKSIGMTNDCTLGLMLDS